MNTHPSAVLLQALEDGEVGARRRAALEAHLNACGRCSDTLAELRSLSHDFSGALARLDRSGEAALTRLSLAGPATGLTAAIEPVPDRPWLRAAAIVGLLVAASSFAGVSALWLRDRLFPGDETVVTTVAAPPAPAAGYASAFALTPATDAVRIELTGLAEGSRVEVRTADDAQVSIEVVAADAPVRFSDPSQGGQLGVAVNGRADVVLALPRALRTATILVDGVVRATSAAGTIDVRAVETGVTVVAGSGVETVR